MHVDSEKMTIHWVRDIPIANLKPAVEEMLPPGHWIYLDQFKQAIDDAVAQLAALNGDSMRGRLRVCISRSLDQIALVELPGAQQELELNSGQTTAPHEPPNSPDTPHNKTEIEASVRPNGGGDIQTAIAISESLLAQNNAGEYLTAEAFLHALDQSPDPKLTANALKSAGFGSMIHGVGGSFNPGAHKPFPELLESAGIFHIRFKDCTDVSPTEVKADFKRLHEFGQNTESSVGQLLKFRQRLPVSLAGSMDAALFRVGGAAELELDAQVSVTVSTFERSIKRLTLVRLINREETLRQLGRFLEQLRLPFDERFSR